MTLAFILSLAALTLTLYVAWTVYVINNVVMVLIEDYQNRMTKEDPRTYNPDAM